MEVKGYIFSDTYKCMTDSRVLILKDMIHYLFRTSIKLVKLQTSCGLLLFSENHAGVTCSLLSSLNDSTLRS